MYLSRLTSICHGCLCISDPPLIVSCDLLLTDLHAPDRSACGLQSGERACAVSLTAIKVHEPPDEEKVEEGAEDAMRTKRLGYYEVWGDG